jgi:hypothetical protein
MAKVSPNSADASSANLVSVVNKGGRPKGSKNKVVVDKQAEDERAKAEQEQRDREAAAAEEDKKKRKKPNKFPAEGACLSALPALVLTSVCRLACGAE